MTEDPYSLNSIFGDSAGKLPGLDLGGTISALASSFGQDASAITDAISNGVSQALTLDLGNVLGKAWAGTAQVKAARESTAKDLDAVAFVPLAPHRIVSTHTPNLDLLLAGTVVKSLPLSIVVAMDFLGVELEVQGGQIVSAKSGKMEAEGEIHLSASPILKAVSKPYELKGKLTFVKDGAGEAPSV
jgi:hypothetical protein